MNIEKRLGCDSIDESIYRCFVDGRSWCFAESLTGRELGLSESKQDKIYFPRRERILDEIAKVCADHGGKLFKSKAKGAEWAILGASYYWDPDRVAKLHAQGYKVTYFTNAVRFFGLESLWKSDVQERFFEKERVPSLPSPTARLLGKAASGAVAVAKAGIDKKVDVLGRIFGWR